MNLRTRKQVRVSRHGVVTAVAFCLFSAVASVTGGGVGGNAGAAPDHAVEAESPRDRAAGQAPMLLCAL